MSGNRSTLALVVAAVAVAVTAFLVLRPSDDSPSSSSSATTTTSPSSSPGTTTASTKGDGPSTLPEATVIHLVGGQPVGGKQKISVKKGDTIRLKVTSDEAGEIHVHGFDLEQEAAPGKPASFAFTANIEGRFEVESHVSDAQIAEISVNP
jgi:FtsP/CotA-like multicopper oxidase with cupredoxin domain